MVSPPTRLPLAAVALAVILCGLSVLASAPTAQGGQPALIIVNSSADTDDGFCDVQEVDGCTLREAINYANLIENSADTIVFDVSSVHVNSELPYFTDPAGVIVDGFLAGGERFLLQLANGSSANFGLVFFASQGTSNVTVKNFRVFAFDYEGIQVCGGPAVNGSCTGAVSDVTLDNVRVTSTFGTGIDIFGSSIENVQLTDVDVLGNDGSGVLIQSGGDLSGIEIVGGESDNGIHGYNLSGVFASNISFTGARSGGNGELGYSITASALSGLTMSDSEATENGLSGVGVDVVGSLSNVSMTGGTYADNGGSSVRIEAGSFATGLFSGIAFGDTDGSGVDMEAGEISDVTVQDSSFTQSGAAVSYSADRGSGNLVIGNTITDPRGYGIVVEGAAISGSTQVRISRNSMSGSDYAGIDLRKSGDPSSGLTPNDPGDADEGPNKLLNFPEFSGNTAEALTGTTCANCLVELFVANKAAGQRGDGVTYLRDINADGSGNFSLPLCGLNKPAGTVVTTTATDDDGNTSEFSTNVALIANTPANCPTEAPTPSPTQPGQTATPTPSPTTVPTNTAGPSPTVAPGARKQGDLDCTGSVDGADAIIALRFKAGLSLPSRPAGCPSIGSGSPKFGDVNCDGKVDVLDALAIVQFWSGATVNPPQGNGCTPLGQDLPS